MDEYERLEKEKEAALEAKNEKKQFQVSFTVVNFVNKIIVT